MRHPDWQRRLHAAIEAARERPFLWGEHDCMLFAAQCVYAMTGEDFGNGFRCTYSSANGARRIIIRAGSIEKLLANYLDEVPVKLAQRGDIAVMENGGNRCAAVVWGNGIYAAGPEGLTRFTDKPLSTWRVR